MSDVEVDEGARPSAPLAILWLEDDPADAELGLAQLRRSGLDMTAEIAATAEEFRDALAARSYDVVIADYRLPGWTGMDALDWMRGQGIDTPFILTTGKLDEETAAECIRRGASDCVLKSRLVRLPISLERALEDRAIRVERARAEESLRAVERRWRLLVERSLAAVVRSTPDGRLLDCNPAAARILGYSTPAELLACRASDLYFDPRERDAIVEQIARERDVSNLEICFKRRDGSPVWTLATVTVSDEDPAGPTFESTLIDITERKRSEEKILELNRLYAVLSHLNQAVARIPGRTELLREVCRIAVEDACFRMAWYGEADEASGLVRPVAHFGLEDGYLADVSFSAVDGSTGAALRSGRHFVIQDVASDPAGAGWREAALERGYRSAAGFPIAVQGRAIGLLSFYASQPDSFDEQNVSLLEEMALDVSFALESMERESQRQRAESERAELVIRERAARAEALAEARFRELLEAAPDAILEVGPDGRILLLNAAAELLFGYTRGELLGAPVEFLVPEALRETHVRHRASYNEDPVRRSIPFVREVRARRKDGAEIPVDLSVSPVRSEQDGRVTCILRDATARKEADAALLESHRRTVSVLESITDGFFAIDRDWRFTYLNRKAEQLINRSREALLGRNLWQEFPELGGTVLQHQFRRAAAGGVAVEFTAEYPSLGIWAEFHVYPSESGLSVYFHDITASRQLEEQFRQSQKMEALGRLAGGVAHDFNNLLTIIGGYGQMLFESVEPRNPMKRDLEAIVEAANRASALTRQLLAFSRRQIVQPKVLQLNRLVAKMNRMLRRVIGEDIELRLAPQQALPRIKADPGQLEQVILNLVVNARDAMPKGGRLTIESAERELPGTWEGSPGPALGAGRYVVLSISDTGTGMDAETRSHLFEPFFTTKPKGKGTGLGLSTAYGIVKQSGGEITVDTEPGKGSTFRIWLPASDGPLRRARSVPREASLKGAETLLVVEDEDDVRKLACTMLERQGYRVIEASGGAEALAVWQDCGDSVDLLLTDVVMPHMSGVELAGRLSELRPNLRVLFMSGYTDDVISEHGILEPGAAFVAKPFTPHTLAAMVRQALDGSE